MSPSPKGSKKPALALSKVPSVKELCDSLGFQLATLKETNSFTDATHAWRKSYKTSDGIPGTMLLLWNQPSVQMDLTTMAERFLEDQCNGERFWSPIRSWNPDPDIQYPEDRSRIIELLKQLFWKQNRYAANNSTYGHRGIDSRDGSQGKGTPIRETFQTEDEAPWTILTTYDSESELSEISEIEHDARPVKPVKFVFRRQENEDQRVYDLDEDDEPTEQQLLTAAQLPKHGRPEQKPLSRDVPPRKKKKYNAGESPRRTARKVMPRSRPGIIPDEVVDAILKSPTIQPMASYQHSHEPETLDNRTRHLQTSPEMEGVHRNAASHTAASLRTFSAPTAPMISPNEGENSLSASSNPSRTMLASRVPSWKQISFQDPRTQPHIPSKTQAVRSPRPKISPKSQLQSPSPYSPGLIKPQVIDESTRLSLLMRGIERNFPVNKQKIVSASKRPFDAQQRLSSTSPHPIEVPTVSPAPSRDTATPRPHVQRTKTTPIDSEFEIHEMTSSDLTPSFKPHQAGAELSADNAKPKPRPKTQVPLWIITREPRYTEERWDEGKFQGTPLSVFIEEVSKVTQRGHIEKLKLTLRTPTFDTKITVFKDAEDSWDSARETFVEKLKEARVEAKAKRPNETPSFKILVEPFYEQGAALLGNSEDDDEEFEF